MRFRVPIFPLPFPFNCGITETTLRTVPGLLNPTQDGYHDTDPDRPEPIWDLDNPLE